VLYGIARDLNMLTKTNYMAKPSAECASHALQSTQFVQANQKNHAVYYVLGDPNDWEHPAISYWLLPSPLILIEHQTVRKYTYNPGDIFIINQKTDKTKNAIIQAAIVPTKPIYTNYCFAVYKKL
jgi:hypothetical protein